MYLNSSFAIVVLSTLEEHGSEEPGLCVQSFQEAGLEVLSSEVQGESAPSMLL